MDSEARAKHGQDFDSSRPSIGGACISSSSLGFGVWYFLGTKNNNCDVSSPNGEFLVIPRIELDFY